MAGSRGEWDISLLLLLALLMGACRDVDRLTDVAPRAIVRVGGPAVQAAPAPLSARAPLPLPPAQPTDGYEFQPIGVDNAGWLRFRIRILLGGSPFLVAVEKLTPLFQVDGKSAAQYVGDAYFEANPGRTPYSIQPDDEFVLSVPPDTFTVRWQQERVEERGGQTRLREFISERGDRLRFYLTDRFPILYELESADAIGTSTLQFHPDLAFLLGSGRLDTMGLARLIYRVPDPDVRQVQIVRGLAAEVKPGQSAKLVVDRTTTYLDPVREAMSHGNIMKRVPYPGRNHLMQATFSRDQGLPFVAIEDALGAHPDVAELPAGPGPHRVRVGRHDPRLLHDRRRRARPTRPLSATGERALGGPLRRERRRRPQPGRLGPRRAVGRGRLPDRARSVPPPPGGRALVRLPDAWARDPADVPSDPHAWRPARRSGATRPVEQPAQPVPRGRRGRALLRHVARPSLGDRWQVTDAKPLYPVPSPPDGTLGQPATSDLCLGGLKAADGRETGRRGQERLPGEVAGEGRDGRRDRVWVGGAGRRVTSRAGLPGRGRPASPRWARRTRPRPRPVRSERVASRTKYTRSGVSSRLSARDVEVQKGLALGRTGRFRLQFG